MNQESPAFDVSSDCDSPLVDAVAANGYVLECPPLTVYLARSFGFCYGVRRAIELAYAARRDFPNAHLRLTAEIIHNPQVNARLREMGIEISAATAADLPPPDRPGDVVLIPAFGLPTEREAILRQTGAKIIDTTCSSVKQVWRRVENLARDGFTAVIHGNPKHEETVATASRAVAAGGRWIIVRDLKRAQVLADAVRGTAPLLPETLGEGTLSPGFRPEDHLLRLGMANQTTMLRSESVAISETLGAAVFMRDGGSDANFRNFDTICNATQERQDAVRELAELHPDLVLVIGGFNSSNTTHLAHLASQFATTRHIEDAEDLHSPFEMRHLPGGKHDPEILTDAQPWIKRRIAITAGASTPNRTVGQVIERLRTLAGELKMD